MKLEITRNNSYEISPEIRHTVQQCKVPGVSPKVVTASEPVKFHTGSITPESRSHHRQMDPDPSRNPRSTEMSGNTTRNHQGTSTGASLKSTPEPTGTYRNLPQPPTNLHPKPHRTLIWAETSKLTLGEHLCDRHCKLMRDFHQLNQK